MYSREELLSSTCSTANISVAMVDRSPPKFCLHFWGILHIIENNALHKVAYLCIHASMDDMTEQGSIVPSCWAAHAELRTWLGWTMPSYVNLLQPHLPIVVSVTSSDCSNTGEFYPHIPLQNFSECLRVQDVVTFYQHQCKITWVQLCFQCLHQWLLIITIATLRSYRAMLQ